MTHGQKRWVRRAGWILFLIYLVLLVYFLFFAEEYGRQGTGTGEYRYNLVPFEEIRRFWIYRQQVGVSAAFLNLAGNVIGFMPFGFLLPVMAARMRHFRVTVPLGFLLSLSVEVIQLFTRVGSFDVDDLMLNTLGVVLGYLLFILLNGIMRMLDHGKKI